jgi:acetyl esterase/lipase
MTSAAVTCLLKSPTGGHPKAAFDLFVPTGGAVQALVACFAGGWWTADRHEDLRLFCLALAEAGFACAAIGHPALGDGARNGQDIVDECRAGVVRALEECALLGGDGKSLVTLGSGSGSLLALVLAAQLGQDPKLRVRACVAAGVTPTLDHADGLPIALLKTIDQFAGGQRHALSPMHLRADHFPPLLLLHGDGDQDIPAKTANRFHMKIIEAGEASSLAVLTGLGHQFIEHPQDRGGRAALERIVPFLQEHTRQAAEAGR